MKGLTALHSHGRGEKVKKFEACPGPSSKTNERASSKQKRSHPRIPSAVLHEPASEKKRKKGASGTGIGRG